MRARNSGTPETALLANKDSQTPQKKRSTSLQSVELCREKPGGRKTVPNYTERDVAGNEENFACLKPGTCTTTRVQKVVFVS